MLTGHHKELSDHSCTLSDVLLNQLGPRDPDKCAISMVGNGSGEKSLSCSGRAIHEDSLGLSNAQRLKDLRMFDGEFDDFFNFFDLLVQASNHVIGGIWHFFDLHERNERIDLSR